MMCLPLLAIQVQRKGRVLSWTRYPKHQDLFPNWSSQQEHQTLILPSVELLLLSFHRPSSHVSAKHKICHVNSSPYFYGQRTNDHYSTPQRCISYIQSRETCNQWRVNLPLAMTSDHQRWHSTLGSDVPTTAALKYTSHGFRSSNGSRSFCASQGSVPVHQTPQL